MNEDVLRELTTMKNTINNTIMRLNQFTDYGHKDNADQITEIQELIIDETYDNIIDDIGE